MVAPDEAEDEEAQEGGGAVTEHQPRAKRQRGDRCELLTRKVSEMEKKVSLEQEKVRLTEKKRSPVKRERQALEKSRMKIDQMERALVDLRGELQAARQLAADKVAADKKRSEKAAKKEEETRSMTEAGAIQLVTICLKYHSRFDNRISTHIHDEFTRLVEDGDLQQRDGRSAQALEKRFNIELSAFRLWASAANRAVALSGVPADGVEEKVRAHWRPTTGLFHKSFYAQMPHNPLGDQEEDKEKEHVDERMVHHPVSAGPLRRGQTVCGGSSGGEGSSSHSVYPGPNVRGDDRDGPLGDEEDEKEKEHVDERMVHHPVSAGPLRRGQTVCGGSSGGEGSSSHSVYPGPNVRGDDRDGPLGDEEDEKEKEHVDERMVHHPVSAGPLRRGQTVCGGSSGGEGSSSHSVYPGPNVRGDDRDGPLGDEEDEKEKEHVDERMVHHPVSAGPLRRGQTVCGGSSGGEGSSSHSVYPGPNVRGDDRDGPLGDEEDEKEKEHVDERMVHHPVSAGPLRRGQTVWRGRTVCGGSSGGEGSSSHSVYQGSNIHYPTASPTAAHQLELLHSDDYERGNVRKYPSGLTLPIDAAAADNMRQGRRKNRPGLCYQEHGFDGFSPASWPHVFAAPASGFGHHDAMLQQHPGLGTFGYTQVSVIYEAKPNPKLVGVAETFWEAHKPVRDTDPSAGGMVGTGEHLRRDGHVANFVVADAEARARVAGGMECAGNSFVKRWTGARVGFEELLGHQRRLWGAKSRSWPLCWNMSDGLGNAEHIDPDGYRCYAVWLSKLGHAGASRSWWMLFPRHGLAIGDMCCFFPKVVLFFPIHI